MSLPEKWTELRHRFVLTSEEKCVLTFVITALLLGLATKCYRDKHQRPPIMFEKKHSARSQRSSGGRD